MLSQEAVDLRDALVEKLASMPPIGAALDQLLHHFGHDDVAEVTGRSRRVLRISDDGRGDRLAVKSRPASANLHETQAFMDGKKRILVFSGAGNTGRSYHADLACANTKRRRHYLLEAGWQANQAIQGLGRTHRTRQKSAPLFSPGHHQREGRAAVHLHHRAAHPQPRGDHARAEGLAERDGRRQRGALP